MHAWLVQNQSSPDWNCVHVNEIATQLQYSLVARSSLDSVVLLDSEFPTSGAELVAYARWNPTQRSNERHVERKRYGNCRIPRPAQQNLCRLLLRVLYLSVFLAKSRMLICDCDINGTCMHAASAFLPSVVSFSLIPSAPIPVVYALVTGDDRDRLALADSVPRRSTMARRIIYSNTY